MNLRGISYIVLLLFIINSSYSQITRVRGTVFNKKTGEPLPFVSVLLKGTSVGANTDFHGQYDLKTDLMVDTLVFSFLGYHAQSVAVKRGVDQNVSPALIEADYELEEVVITPGENPAHPIIRAVNENRKELNPDRLQSLYFSTYSKMELDITNLDKGLKDKSFFKQFGFVFDYIDTSELIGKTYLPAMITESVSDYYIYNNPAKEGEIIKASKISGIKNASISQFTGKMYQKYNIYNNFITVYDPEFISPIGDFSFLYYKYRLKDTVDMSGYRCFEISFKPKFRGENTFQGTIWVTDSLFTVKKISLRKAAHVNINFMNDVYIEQEFLPVKDSVWLISDERIFLDFYIAQSSTGMMGKKTTHYYDYKVNEPLKDTVEKLKSNTHVMDDALSKEESFWDTIRPNPLSQQEKNIYRMVDSLKMTTLYKYSEKFITMLSTYYLVLGYAELGPYFTTYSFNSIEGHRLRLGGRTSNKFSKKFMVGGYVAYGTSDEQFKYGIETINMFSKNPRRSFSTGFYSDVRTIGKSVNAFRDDNIASTLLRRRSNNKLTDFTEGMVSYEHEWHQGFMNTLYLRHRRIYPSPYINFLRSDMSEIPEISTSEIVLRTRLAYQEKFLMGEFERRSLGSYYPILDIYLTHSFKGVLNSNYEYSKIEVSVSDVIEMNPLGYLKFKARAGQLFGQVPFPLLEMHGGNETYAYDYYAFNMMNYYEFVSDRFASVNAEYHFLGFFFNKIPLVRKLKFREVATAKAVMGSLSEKNKNYMIFPIGLNPLTYPYTEVGVGIENIVKFFRVDAIWRMSYLNHPNIEPFGIRVSMQIRL